MTDEDRRWLDEMVMRAVINIYEPWITNGRIPSHEREYAERRVMAYRRELARLSPGLGAHVGYRVMAYRRELARTQDTMPFPVLTMTDGGARA